MSTFDTLVIGDVNADLSISLSTFPHPSNDLHEKSVTYASKYTLHPGGIGATTALTLARLGLKVGIISSVGSSPIGHSLINVLISNNIDISHVKQIANTNSTMILMLEDSQKQRIEIVCKGERKLTSNELDPSYLLSAKMIFVVGHFFTRQDVADLIINKLRLTKKVGKVNIMDPGKFYINPNLLPKLRESLTQINILLPNLYEVKTLTGKDSVISATKSLEAHGIELIAVKMGEEGCYICSKGKRFKIPAFKVKVKDVIGAGDTFNAAFMYGLLQKWDLTKIATFANAAAALKITKTRKKIPTLNEIFTFLERNRSMHI